MKQEFGVVNHYISRRESMEKATGQIAYTDDMNLPDQAYASSSAARIPQPECWVLICPRRKSSPAI